MTSNNLAIQSALKAAATSLKNVLKKNRPTVEINGSNLVITNNGQVAMIKLNGVNTPIRTNIKGLK